MLVTEASSQHRGLPERFQGRLHSNCSGAQYGRDPGNHDKGPWCKIDGLHKCAPKTEVLGTDLSNVVFVLPPGSC